MRQTLNTIYHGLGYMMICTGWIIMIGTAGSSDLGMPLAEVTRCALAGLTACAGGVFLTWWKI